MLQSVAHDTHSLTPTQANTLGHIHRTLFPLNKKKQKKRFLLYQQFIYFKKTYNTALQNLLFGIVCFNKYVTYIVV